MEIDNLVKNKRRNLITLAIVRLLHGFGTGMFMIVYQPFLLELTNSIVLTGLFVSIGTIMQFMPMPLIGKISDKVNRQNVLILSIPIYIIGLLFLINANPNSIYFAVFGIIFYFLGFIMNNVNIQFLIAENSNESKGRIFGFMFFSYFGGTIAGSIFIILGQGLNSRFYLMVFIIILLVEGIFFTFFLTPQIHSKHKIMINKNNKKENMWVKIFKTKKCQTSRHQKGY